MISVKTLFTVNDCQILEIKLIFLDFSVFLLQFHLKCLILKHVCRIYTLQIRKSALRSKVHKSGAQ